MHLIRSKRGTKLVKKGRLKKDNKRDDKMNSHSYRNNFYVRDSLDHVE